MSASELTGADLRGRSSRLGTWLPWAGVAAAGIVVAVGLAIKAATGGLGESLPPFVISWGPAVNPLVAISLLTIAGALGVAPAIVARAPAGPVFAISVYALALALGLGVNLAHEGVRGWWAVFAPRGSQEGPYEYLTGFDALVHGIPYYIRNFAALFPYLPEHAKGNPPGPLIALDLLGIRTAAAMAALCIGLGALTAPLAYDLGRVLGGPAVGEERGRSAALLTAFSPAMILFGVTSADYAFAALGMIAATLLVRRRPAAWIVGCAVAAFAAFFSWLLLAIPAWAVLVVLRRDGVAGRRPAGCLRRARDRRVQRCAAPRLRLGPVQRDARRQRLLRQRHLADAALRVLAVRLADGVGGDDGAADHVVRPALAGGGRGERDRALGAGRGRGGRSG